uniref:Uncharacterized protein n=1 Tax=Romanomermis culicivorax TaxID=13658 RepID=A0A915J5Y3_ROMCU
MKPSPVSFAFNCWCIYNVILSTFQRQKTPHSPWRAGGRRRRLRGFFIFQILHVIVGENLTAVLILMKRSRLRIFAKYYFETRYIKRKYFTDNNVRHVQIEPIFKGEKFQSQRGRKNIKNYLLKELGNVDENQPPLLFVVLFFPSQEPTPESFSCVTLFAALLLLLFWLLADDRVLLLKLCMELSVKEWRLGDTIVMVRQSPAVRMWRTTSSCEENLQSMSATATIKSPGKTLHI